MKKLVAGMQAAGKTVAFTNGCFDIMHVGHIRYLEEARGLADCLIVGVNTDDSVKSGKGDKRPILSQFHRAEVVAALACVDYVVLFSEKTAATIIEHLRPDIYVKGGDYTLDRLPEVPAVQSYGGEIVIVPLVEGCSTTSIVNRVLEVMGKDQQVSNGQEVR